MVRVSERDTAFKIACPGSPPHYQSSRLVNPREYAFSPAGQIAYATGTRIVLVKPDGTTREFPRSGNISWRADNTLTIASVRGRHKKLEDLDVWTFEERAVSEYLFTFPLQSGNFMWSPDGNRLAYVVRADNENLLFVYDFSRRTHARFEVNGGSWVPSHILWNSDSETLLSVWDCGSHHCIYLHRVSSARNIPHSVQGIYPVSFTGVLTGVRIVEGRLELGSMPIHGLFQPEADFVLPHWGSTSKIHSAAVSPTHLAITLSKHGGTVILVFERESGSLIQEIEGGMSPQFSPVS